MPSGGFVPASILTVAGPAVGAWTVSLDGSGEFSLNVTGVSTLDLSSFRFVHELPGYGGPFDMPLPGLPPAGRPSTADAFVSGRFASAAFDLRSRAGDVLQTLALTAVSDPAAGEFTGDVTPPGTPFRVYVTGKDLAGNEFQRAVPAVIQPQVVVVTPPASSELRPGQTSSFAFQVQNLGGVDTAVTITATYGATQSTSINVTTCADMVAPAIAQALRRFAGTLAGACCGRIVAQLVLRPAQAELCFHFQFCAADLPRAVQQ